MALADILSEHQKEVTRVKEECGPGPWQDEPDRVEFKHEGLDCLLNRNRIGAWCGYVAVRPGHPAFGKHYDAVDISVHGGLTYADNCHGVICHVTENDNDKAYWFGFDCAHYMDLVPGMEVTRRILEEKNPEFAKLGLGLNPSVYRDLEYVKEETMALAKQLKAMKN